MGIRSVDGLNTSSPSTTLLESEDVLIGAFFEWLYSMTRVFDEQFRKVGKTTGLNRNQILIIGEISRSPSITASELAKRMHLSPVNMVRSLNHLENLGFITRARSIIDRRVVEILISEKADSVKMIFANLAHDILASCQEVTDEGDFLRKLKQLHNLSFQPKAAINSHSDSESATLSKGNQ